MYTKDTHTKDSAKNATTDLQDDLRLIKEKARETRDAISQTAHDVKDRAQDAFTKSLHDAREKNHGSTRKRCHLC